MRYFILALAITLLPTPALADAFSSAVIGYGPTVYYRLDDSIGSTSLADSSGNGRTGSVGGTVTLGATGLIVGSSDTAMTVTTSGFGKMPNTVPSLTKFTLVVLDKSPNFSAGQVCMIGYYGNCIARNGATMEWYNNFLGQYGGGNVGSFSNSTAYFLVLELSFSSGVASVRGSVNGGPLTNLNRNSLGSLNLLTANNNWIGITLASSHTDTVDEAIVYPFLLSTGQIANLCTIAGYCTQVGSSNFMGSWK